MTKAKCPCEPTGDCPSENGIFVCTRKFLHRGEHRACNWEQIVSSWPNKRKVKSLRKLISKMKLMREALLAAAREIERESNLYRDGETYRPHGVSLRTVSAMCRRAAVIRDFI